MGYGLKFKVKFMFVEFLVNDGIELIIVSSVMCYFFLFFLVIN